MIKMNNMDRQEGYYWVKDDHGFLMIAYWSGNWFLHGTSKTFIDSDFEHINENRIKEPGELPD